MSVEIGLFLLILGLFPLKNLKKKQKSNLRLPKCSTNFSDLSFWILHLYTSKGLNPKFRAQECILKVLSINDTSFLSKIYPCSCCSVDYKAKIQSWVISHFSQFGNMIMLLEAYYAFAKHILQDARHISSYWDTEQAMIKQWWFYGSKARPLLYWTSF